MSEWRTFFTQIVTVNRLACHLLGYSSQELRKMKFSSLVERHKALSALAQVEHLSEDNSSVMVSGRVVSEKSPKKD